MGAVSSLVIFVDEEEEEPETISSKTTAPGNIKDQTYNALYVKSMGTLKLSVSTILRRKQMLPKKLKKEKKKACSLWLLKTLEKTLVKLGSLTVVARTTCQAIKDFPPI